MRPQRKSFQSFESARPAMGEIFESFQEIKKRIQLQSHRDALEKVLKHLDKCIDKIDDPTFQLEVNIPLQDMIGGIFPKETRYLTEILRETCNIMKTQLEELKNNYKLCIKNIYMSARKSTLISSENVYEMPSRELLSCSLSQSLEKAMSALLSMLVEVSGIFSRRSFEAAFLTAETLESKLQQAENVYIAEPGIRDMDKKCIHPTWSVLADKGCSLLAKMRNYLDDETITTVINALVNVGNSLNNKIKELHNLIFSGSKKELANVIFRELKSLENFNKYILVDYIFKHLQTLRDALIEHFKFSGVPPLPEDLEYYLKIVFEDGCFLEYEVYAALLEHGVPALPRVPLTYTRVVQSEGKDYWEKIENVITDIDVVAALGDNLWLIEVTKSERQDKLEGDVNELELLARRLGAEGALMVCTRAAREKAENDIKTEKVLFIAFEDLYSELHRLLWNRSAR